MGIEFINRVVKTSLIVSVIAFVFITFYYNFKFGSGILVGTGWSCLNLYFLANLIKEALNPQKPKKTKITLIILVKFPLLYFLGYLILRLNYFPVLSLLAGFTLIFLVIFLKALGKWFLSLSSENKSALGSVERKSKG
ncbi:MAG: hypothetical protein AMJ90_07130 [candidate division Zixibacteria bacterium SM23_73_2]|nr:MAG: hypothetical protein AMJ90_07130 [candidate division Zixibacteria bacterium SM23_73_2]